MELWVSCSAMTCWVKVFDGRIVDAAPILRRFIGQPQENLLRWLKGKWGEVQCITLRS